MGSDTANFRCTIPSDVTVSVSTTNSKGREVDPKAPEAVNSFIQLEKGNFTYFAEVNRLDQSLSAGAGDGKRGYWLGGDEAMRDGQPADVAKTAAAMRQVLQKMGVTCDPVAVSSADVQAPNLPSLQEAVAQKVKPIRQ